MDGEFQDGAVPAPRICSAQTGAAAFAHNLSRRHGADKASRRAVFGRKFWRDVGVTWRFDETTVTRDSIESEMKRPRGETRDAVCQQQTCPRPVFRVAQDLCALPMSLADRILSELSQAGAIFFRFLFTRWHQIDPNRCLQRCPWPSNFLASSPRLSTCAPCVASTRVTHTFLIAIRIRSIRYETRPDRTISYNIRA